MLPLFSFSLLAASRVGALEPNDVTSVKGQHYGWDPGSPECPCITNMSSIATGISKGITSLGHIPQNYGINGCHQYDYFTFTYPQGCDTNGALECKIDIFPFPF